MKRRTLFALGWALVVCLLVLHDGYLWLGQRIAPDTDILALLPVQQRDPVLQASFGHMVDSAQQRLVILVGAPKWDDAKRAADAYGAVLAGRPDLLAAPPQADAMEGDWLAQFSPHRLTLLSTTQDRQLRSEGADFWLDAARRKLYGAFSGPKIGAWRDDPFGLFDGWVQERAQETPVRPRDGRLFVADAAMQYVVLPLTLKQPAFSLAAQESLLPLLDQADSAARRQQSDAQIIKAGMVLHAAAAGAQANREMSTIGLGSLIGIVLLMWLSFGSLRPILLIVLSIGVGFLGSFAVCWALFGRIHLLTLVFGASLIGVAQDYGIYFLCSRLNAEQKQDSVALLRRIMPGLGLTLLTTAIGYLALALTPFPGLRQMALFSAFGLVFAWFTVVFWFPLLVGTTPMKSGALVRWYVTARARWPAWGWNGRSLFAAAVVLVLAAVGCLRLGVNDDIRLLQNPPADLVKQQIALSRLLDSPTPAQYFLVRGPSAEIVLQREEQLKSRLDPLVAQQHLGGYQSLSNWVPSLRTQEQRRALVQQKLLQDGAVLAQLANSLGESPAWVADTRAHLLEFGQVMTPDEFLRAPASEPWRFLWLGKVDGVYASIVALRGLHNADLPQVRLAGAGLEGVQWVDKVQEISSVLGKYRVYMGWVVLASYLAVYALLYWRYRRATWRVLAPAAIASIGTLAILGMAGQNLQLFHVLALMLLLGVGVDYGIFLHEHPGRREATPWLAIGLSAASTILSFGLLGLSRTPALQAFGVTMLLGTALVWLLAPCFGRDEA